MTLIVTVFVIAMFTLLIVTAVTNRPEKNRELVAKYSAQNLQLQTALTALREINAGAEHAASLRASIALDEINLLHIKELEK